MKFGSFIPAKQSHSSQQHEEWRHVWRAALFILQPRARWEVLLWSSSRAIRAAVRSSRNPNSVSGTFLWVQSKRDRLHSGLPKTSAYTRGFHPRPANFLPSTHLPLPMKSFTLTHSNFLQPETLTRQIAHNFCVSFRALNFTLRTRRHSYVRFHWCGLFSKYVFRTGAAENWYFPTIFSSLNVTILLQCLKKKKKKHKENAFYYQT